MRNQPNVYEVGWKAERVGGQRKRGKLRELGLMGKRGGRERVGTYGKEERPRELGVEEVGGRPSQLGIRGKREVRASWEQINPGEKAEPVGRMSKIWGRPSQLGADQFRGGDRARAEPAQDLEFLWDEPEPSQS